MKRPISKLPQGWVFTVCAAALSVATMSATTAHADSVTMNMSQRLAALPPSIGPAHLMIDVLAKQVVDDYIQLPTIASDDDVEAGVVYAVSQSKLGQDDKITGLERAARVADAKLLKAIEAVIAALKSGKLKTGTAGTVDGNTSDFSVPSVNVGGGSSNYSGN
ncbi:hypothetical protein [Novosphingobium sp.]|uniref:hypothetical protein n=1 Tax=Novosphingobium sp. TaxID=1874826 RepID=UPI003D12F688